MVTDMVNVLQPILRIRVKLATHLEIPRVLSYGTGWVS